MKPQLKDQKLQSLYRFCLYLFWGILILYVLSILVITVISATTGSMLSSPIWGLFALLGTLPVVFPLVATFLFLRQLLAIKTNALTPRRHHFEMTFAVLGYILAWLTAIFTLFWLLGAYPMMYAAIGTALLLMLFPLTKRLLQKRYIR